MSLAAIEARAHSKAGNADPRHRAQRFRAAEQARQLANLKAEGFVIPLSEWIGHNNGPDWHEYALFVAYCWKKAFEKAWTPPSQEIAARRARRAEELGLTYRQYALEIMEHGRFPDEALAARLRQEATP
jgi:hypothetical protein